MFRSSSIRQVTCVLAAAFALLSHGAAARAEEAVAGLRPTASLTGKSGGLTAEEVAHKATSTSPAVDEKKQDVAAARANVDRALADLFPRLSFSGSYSRLSPVTNPALGNLVVAPGAAEGPLPAGTPLAATALSIPSLENSTNVSTTLNIPLSDYVFRLVQAHDGARAQATATERSLRASERKAAYDARELYYRWVRAELETAVAVQNLDLGKEHLVHLRKLASADSASEADVARVDSTVASSEYVVVQQKNLAALERARLSIAMHETPREYTIGEDFGPAPQLSQSPGELDALVRRAQSDRPELGALSAQALAYEKQAAAETARALPRLDAFATGTVANPNQRRFPQTQDFRSSWQVGVQLTYAPNDTATGLSQSAATRHKQEAVLAQHRQLLDAVRAEVTEAVLSHQTAVAGLDSTARRLVAAETSYRARRDRFHADRATTVELTEAQTDLFRARLDAVQAQVAIRVAKVRLAYATGRDR